MNTREWATNIFYFQLSTTLSTYSIQQQIWLHKTNT